MDKKQFYIFKERLGDIIEYYDFSYIKNISENNFYWYETSHFRDIVGDKIIDKIYYNKVLDIIPNKNIPQKDKN